MTVREAGRNVLAQTRGDSGFDQISEVGRVFSGTSPAVAGCTAFSTDEWADSEMTPANRTHAVLSSVCKFQTEILQVRLRFFPLWTANQVNTRDFVLNVCQISAT